MKKRQNILRSMITVLFFAVTIAASAQKVGLNVGDKAPAISEKGVDDKVIELSSLKGKIVLIDFWASWCGPCRKENPVVVKAYNTYKDSAFEGAKGFTVFGVSLDQKKDRWEAAIAKDQLAWPYHVSDLKGWYSKSAKLYNVRSIPANYLIDANGIIIAKNLRGEALLNKLKELSK